MRDFNVIERVLDGQAETRAKIAAIVADVARVHKLPAAEITGRGKRGPVALARQTAQFLAYRRGLTLAQIARGFGCDHTTVMWNIRAVERRTGVLARPVVGFRSRRAVVTSPGAVIMFKSRRGAA